MPTRRRQRSKHECRETIVIRKPSLYKDFRPQSLRQMCVPRNVMSDRAKASLRAKSSHRYYMIMVQPEFPNVNSINQFLATMSVVGGLAFCTDCGNLLTRVTESTSESSVACDVCLTKNLGMLIVRDLTSDVDFPTVPPSTPKVSHSRPDDYPSKLRDRRAGIKDDTLDAATSISSLPSIKQDCPKCDAKELHWRAQQTRSADEGSTIMYYCVCGYR